LKRGMPVNNTGGPISVPVGEGTLGRILNVIGDPVDNRDPVKFTKRYPIHRKPPRSSNGYTDVDSRDRHQGHRFDLSFTKGGNVGAFGPAGFAIIEIVPEPCAPADAVLMMKPDV